jgi:hypothetical protein
MIHISVFQYLNNLFEQGTFTTASNARNNLIGLSINGTMRAICTFLSIIIEKLIKNTQFFDCNLKKQNIYFFYPQTFRQPTDSYFASYIKFPIGVNLNPHLIIKHIQPKPF